MPNARVTSQARPTPVRFTLGERELYVGAAALILVVLLATAQLVYTSHVRSVAARLAALISFAATLSEDVDHALQGVELAQRSLAATVRDLAVSTPEQFRSALSGAAIHQLMRDRMAGVPFIDALSIADAQGDIINSTRIWPPPPVRIDDRPYFKELKSPSGPPFVISEPHVGRISQRSNLFLAQRVASPSGVFLGILNGALDKSHFDAAFEKAGLGPDSRIALVRNDGVVLASFPGLSATAPHHPHASALLASALKTLPPTGGTLQAGILDGSRRYAAMHAVSHFPLSVVVTQTSAAVENGIRELITPVVIAAFLVCLVVGLFAFFLARQIRCQNAFAEFQHRQARTDTLTGLPNRIQLSEHLDVLLAADRNAPFALLFLDLDYFKVVNETLGHDMGDVLLRAAAGRMAALLGPHDMAARLGGDEFALVRQGPKSGEEAMALAEDVIAALGEPFRIGHHRIAIGCSVGIAQSPEDGRDQATLLKNADLALHQAKADGRGLVRKFDDALGQSESSRLALQLKLQEAWRERQFILAFQPIFETGTRRLVGFEALLRWNHPELGVVPPGVFIPLIEQTGLVLPIGRWVLEAACRTAVQWPSHLIVSVNLSPVQFRSGTVVGQVMSALERSGLAGGRLELEVTESMLLHDEQGVRGALDVLRRMGVSIALDDFGTGYSSLSYLRTLNINRIKIDRSFIQHAACDPAGRAIVDAVLRLSQALSLKTTAEGIETEEQAKLLEGEGCTHLQGFLLGRPCSGDEALRLARQAAA